jgi:diguanylate cyclase (GGDEF)-like protein
MKTFRNQQQNKDTPPVLHDHRQDNQNDVDRDDTNGIVPRYLALVVSLTLIGMTCFEVLKLIVRAYINMWEALLLTILFSTSLSGFATYLALHRYSRLNKQLEREIAIRRKLERELIVAATVDKLTQIYNRRKLEDIIHQEIDRAKRYEIPLSLIMLDLDDFKSVNDTYGHLVGDDVLRTVASIIKSNIRASDSAGRWGGEEFMILVPETGLERARGLAEKIRHLIASHHFDQSCCITISLGLSEFQPGDTFDSFISRADNALYRAKTNGKNRAEAVT